MLMWCVFLLLNFRQILVFPAQKHAIVYVANDKSLALNRVVFVSARVVCVSISNNGDCVR